MGMRLTRRAVCVGLAPAPFAKPLAAQVHPTLAAREASVQLAPAGYPETSVQAYDGLIPGPAIGLPQEGRVVRRQVNVLSVPTPIHWHGIRIDNGIHGTLAPLRKKGSDLGRPSFQRRLPRVEPGKVATAGPRRLRHDQLDRRVLTLSRRGTGRA